MDKEILKPENVEGVTDLYDGMIFEALSNFNYIASLDYFTLNKLRERLVEYYKIMNDSDYTKGEKLTEKLGRFINKYNLKSMLNHVTFLVNKESDKLDDVDTLIISFIDDHEALNDFNKEQLKVLRIRLMAYYFLLTGDDEEIKKETSERLHNATADSVKEMLDCVEGLLDGGEVKGR